MKESDNWSDKEVVEAFVHMLKTIILWVIWLVISLFFGVQKGWAYFNSPIVTTWEHILFFAWIVIMLPIVIRITFKIWKPKKK
ncbi:MAG TPA: hypothetical protein VK084_04795 [Chitinophagaceae bacterium]|nr:hypothetical protein [Chitinophagaceae bacterium]